MAGDNTAASSVHPPEISAPDWSYASNALRPSKFVSSRNRSSAGLLSPASDETTGAWRCKGGLNSATKSSMCINDTSLCFSFSNPPALCCEFLRELNTEPIRLKVYWRGVAGGDVVLLPVSSIRSGVTCFVPGPFSLTSAAAFTQLRSVCSIKPSPAPLPLCSGPPSPASPTIP